MVCREKVIRAGDPYQWQVERTAAAIVARLGSPGCDWTICYQSRVGPLKWIGPSTDERDPPRRPRRQAGGAVSPIAFVSEHSETLVELDIEYRELAHREGVPDFHRVATVGTEAAFIGGLAALVTRTLADPSSPVCNDGAVPACAEVWRACPRLASPSGAALRAKWPSW